MISDVRLAELAAQAYVGPWDWVTDGHLRARRFDEDGYVVVAIEGTTLDGFAIVRDMRPFPWWHPTVGFCPAGPLKGALGLVLLLLRDLADDLKAGRVILDGHSLGGQVAFLVGGILVAIGRVPAAIAAFDPPRSGLWKLRRLIGQVPYAFYTRHGVDIVPWWFPIFLHPARCMRIGTKRNRLRVLWDVLRCKVKADICPAITDHRIAEIEASLRGPASAPSATSPSA